MPEVEKIDDKTLAVFKKKGYKILNPLGSGSYGMVYKVEMTKIGQFSACKVMNLEQVEEKIRNKFLPREMAAMIQSKHKNVIQLFDIFKSNRRLYIFMEFATNGDIMGYLKKHGPIPLKKAHFWFGGTCEGLDYLHNTLFLAHRDIKVDNILLDENNIPKISDFGFAKKSYNEETDEVILSDTFCGTEGYQSIQILKRKKFDPFKADMWAMGVVLFGMLNDKFPFHFGNRPRQINEIETPEHINTRYIKEFCKHVRHLIRKMLEIEESDRYSIKDVLEHKWIRKKLKCCDKSMAQTE